MPRLPLAALAAALAFTACSSGAQTALPAPEASGDGSARAEVDMATLDATLTALEAAQEPQNLVLFIADGFGPTSATMGAAAAEALGREWVPASGLVGAVETSATDNRVTDSAAGATAYSCGVKTYNGAIGMNPDKTPCRTILEAAEARGMATGLVATSRITHATPASFAAHVEQRSQEADIAEQFIASGVDLFFGGGLGFFQGRDDGRDLLREFEETTGAITVTDGASFSAITSLPAAAVMASSHLAYEVDRDETDEPSLAEMTTRAMDLLGKEAGARGFFLMVEASRIDHAGHGNDPVGHLHDILAYNEALGAARDWAEENGGTLIVATSDHETGGMSLGRDGIYAWDPQPILDATASLEGMGNTLASGGDPVEIVREGLGVGELEDGVAEAIRGAVRARDRGAVSLLIRDLISEPAGIGWTTSGHTAVDVGLYAWGPGMERFRGHMTNDEVGRRLFAALGLTP